MQEVEYSPEGVEKRSRRSEDAPGSPLSRDQEEEEEDRRLRRKSQCDRRNTGSCGAERNSDYIVQFA